MTSIKQHGARSGDTPYRGGAVTVEFAVVAPIMFMLLFAVIEFGRCMMVSHGLEQASREGCRAAILWHATARDVETVVAECLRAYRVTKYTLTVTPSEPARAQQWQPVSVQVSVPYSKVSWIPVPRFIRSVTLTGSCTLPQESKSE